MIKKRQNPLDKPTEWFYNSCVLCPKMEISWLPFQTYLYIEFGTYNYRKKYKPYKLSRLYADYRSYCVRHHIQYEPPENFGLDNV